MQCLSMHVRMYVCLYVCIYVCMYVCVCILYICMVTLYEFEYIILCHHMYTFTQVGSHWVRGRRWESVTVQ